MTVWSSNHNDQQIIISRIEGKLNQLRTRVKPVTLYSATTPTESQLAAAWGTQYSPQQYETVQWLDAATDTLRNQWQRIPDLVSGASTGTFRPTLTYPSGILPFTKIGEILLDAAGGTALTIASIPQTFRHLMLYVQLRDTAAATSASCGIRINGLSASNYGASWQGANTGFNPGTEQISVTSWVFFTPAALSARSYYFQGLARFPDYTSTLRMPRMHMRATSLWGNPYTTATTTNYNYFGIYNGAAAISSVSVVSSTGFAAGSRLVLYGV